MTVVGIVLIILAALVLVATLAGGSDATVSLDLGLFNMSTTGVGVFLIGAATALIFASGLELLRLGLGRSLSRRRELRQARAVMAQHERREHQQAPGAGAGTEPGGTAETGPTGTSTTGTTGTGTTGTGTTGTGTGEPGTGRTEAGGPDTEPGAGGSHRATRRDTSLPGKPVGTDPDTGGPLH
jgi:hypothetical protein